VGGTVAGEEVMAAVSGAAQRPAGKRGRREATAGEAHLGGTAAGVVEVAMRCRDGDKVGGGARRRHDSDVAITLLLEK
jgi:hypothetical protein